MDSSGDLVQEFPVQDVHAGVNRTYWNLRHSGPTPRSSGDGGGGGFSRFMGLMGAPALPGTYTATVIVGESELEGSTTFELRGDPRITMSQADFQAWHDGSQALVDMLTEANQMLDQMTGLQTQLGNLKETVDDADVADLDAVNEQIEAATTQLGEFDNKMQRPPPQMSYRQYPRISDEIGRLMSSVAGVQARPTESQVTVLGELEVEVAERRAQLQGIINGAIRELNQMLGNLPAVVVPNTGLIP
jgi:hypothetical protein